jgi:hypothetical protein
MKTNPFMMILFPVLLLIGCMGSGTETTNGIQGRVDLDTIPLPNGSPIQFIAAVYSLEYAPDSGIGIAETTSVDSNGWFHFPSLPDNGYNLFIWNQINPIGAYIPGLSPDTVLPAIALSRTGTIAGTVPDTVNGYMVRLAHVAITGSPFFSTAQAGEPFAMSPVPQGEYRIRAIYDVNEAISGNPKFFTVGKNLSIDPGRNDTTYVDIR